MVSMLEGKEEVKNFFKDLLTLSEVVMISRRIQIAKMLLNGDSIEKIIKKLKVGNATISQVSRWLNNGFGGYKTIIRKFNKQENILATKRRLKDSAPFSLDWMRKKYPAHFLLLNSLMDKKSLK